MRKKIKITCLKNIFVIYILFAVFFPAFVLADCHGIIGDAGSDTGNSSCKGIDCCGDETNFCEWNWNSKADKRSVRGVRVQIYKYDGTGDPQLIGKGVDIWTTNELQKSTNYFSYPDTPNTRIKASCESGHPYGDNLSAIYHSVTDYLDGTHGKVFYDPDFNSYFVNSKVDEYLLIKNSDKTAKSGWLKYNLFDPLAKGDDASLQTINDLFSINDINKVKEMRASFNDYYVTAEILFRFLANDDGTEAVTKYIKDHNGLPGNLYGGTVSEASAFIGYGEVYTALQSEGEDVGLLVTAKGGKGKIIQVPEVENRYYNPSSDTAKAAGCNSAYGYAAWTMICDGCSKNTCATTCTDEGFTQGTEEYSECARNYCKDIPEGADEEGEDYYTCVSTCDSCETKCEDAKDKKQCATDWCTTNETDETKRQECIKTCNKPDKTCRDECSGKSNPDEKKTCAENWCDKWELDENKDKCVEDCTQPQTCEEFCKNDPDIKSCAQTWCEKDDKIVDKKKCVADCTKNSDGKTCKEFCENDSDKESCASRWCYSDNSITDKEKCVAECTEDDNGGDLCQDECSGKTGTALERCAREACKKSSNPDECFEQCTPPEILYWDDKKSEGCQDDFDDHCSGYILDDKIYATSKSFTCSSSLENPNYSLSSRICEDDEGEFGTDLPNIYYKIECQEDLNLSGLPSNELNLHFSVSGTASMYLGYNLDYTKTCKLWYKKAASSTTPSVTANTSSLPTAWFNKTEVEWTQSYSGTQAQYDLEKVKALKEEIKKRIDSMKDWGITADSSVTVTSLANAITEINKLEADNVRKTYEGYLYPSDGPAGERLSCKDWYKYDYTCTWETTKTRSECNDPFWDYYPCSPYSPSFSCFMGRCCCDVPDGTEDKTSKSSFFDYQEPSMPFGTPFNAVCSRGMSTVSTESQSCDDVEDKVEKLLAYYNLAIDRLDKMQEYLEKVEEKGKNQLKLVGDDDYKEGVVELKHKVDINLVTSESTTSNKKLTITLIPISCITETEQTKRYCEFEDVRCHPEKNSYKVDEYNHVTCDSAKLKMEGDYTTIYSYTIAYGLPSSYLMTLSENSHKVYRVDEKCTTAECVKERCEKDKTGAAECIEKKNVLVFDPLPDADELTFTAIEENIKSGKFHIEMSGIGMCPFSANLDCSYNLRSYKECADCGTDLECLKKKCGCDSYCGSNETCMFMYCPEECDACGEYGEPSKCEKEQTCDECLPKCENNATIKNDKVKYAECKHDCCSLNCNPGDQACAAICCFDECNDIYGGSGTEYQECIKECNKPSGNYVFRPIDMDKPFPEREPGANWSGKVEYITRSNDPRSRYYDKTDGRTGDFEYQVTLRSGDITRIKNDYSAGHQTTYKEYERTDKKVEKYCSDFLHNYLNDRLNDKSGSGC